MGTIVGTGLAALLVTATAAGVAVTRDGNAAAESPARAPAGSPVGSSQGVRVERVIDGDTIVLSTGEHVRLIGIDTPERGECGSEAATRALRDRVEGREVALGDPRSVEDRDRYDRLLRYVDVGGRDAGYAVVVAGLAEARYDSLDGYAWHPRQSEYRAADRANEGRCEERERLAAERRAEQVRERWRAARAVAAQAGVHARPGETSAGLLRRARHVLEMRKLAEERRLAAEQRRLAEQQRSAAAPAPDPADEPSTSPFVPPAGWTTDALTPGYTGCRQGYPGGTVNGVYVWKPITC